LTKWYSFERFPSLLFLLDVLAVVGDQPKQNKRKVIKTDEIPQNETIKKFLELFGFAISISCYFDNTVAFYLKYIYIVILLIIP